MYVIEGVIIKDGPKDWQIIQQTNGKADIFLSGSWFLNDKVHEFRIYARVVKEDSGDVVSGWEECKINDYGVWEITLKSIPAGGLYRIETCLHHDDVGYGNALEWSLRGDMVHHVGVGDIFVIAGQSNAAGYAKDPIYDPPEPGIHLLKNSGKWDMASHPMNDSTSTIHEENCEIRNSGHSPFLSFARVLKRNLGYPIGLLQASLGGSALNLWNPDENGILYRNMIKIIESQRGNIKGVLWYQGCTDANLEETASTYLTRFENFIKYLRKDLKKPHLPIFTVQLNRYIVPGSSTDRNWGLVREAQRQAAKTIPEVYIVPALDCSLSDFIHNSGASNLLLGERLAKTALTEIYNQNYICRAPDLSCVIQTERNKLLLIFENVQDRLFTFEVDAGEMPFTVEDEFGTAKIVSYEILNKNELLLTLNRDICTKAVVHGAYEKNPKFYVPIDASTHLPMLSFYNAKIQTF